MLTRVPVNIGPGNTLNVEISSVSGGLDLTTVTACSLLVRRADGSQSTWTTTLEGGATAEALTVQHAFATPDCPSTGNYDIGVTLTYPSGVAYCYAVRIWVCQPQDLAQTPQAGLTVTTAVVQ